LGGVGLVVLGLAAWWVVFAPWRQMWHDYRRLVADRNYAESKLRDEAAELERFEHGLTQLEELVTSVAAEVPHSDAYSHLLRSLTDAATATQLELLNVSPQPTRANGAYLVSDIRLGGRGRSQDFIRFLDRLARENPYQSLQTCSITHPAQNAQATCELAWTVRLYLLPAAGTTPTGGGE
jgi:Tfp pilus assembly protein PilO